MSFIFSRRLFYRYDHYFWLRLKVIFRYLLSELVEFQYTLQERMLVLSMSSSFIETSAGNSKEKLREA